jgi:hypothetical protein
MLSACGCSCRLCGSWLPECSERLRAHDEGARGGARRVLAHLHRDVQRPPRGAGGATPAPRHVRVRQLLESWRLVAYEINCAELGPGAAGPEADPSSMPCWAREAGLPSPEEVTQLRLLARRLRFSRAHELMRAGSCDRLTYRDARAPCRVLACPNISGPSCSAPPTS